MFWHIEVWLLVVPHLLVPLWPSSVVAGRFDAEYVALYVCARARSGRQPRARARGAARNIVGGLAGKGGWARGNRWRGPGTSWGLPGELSRETGRWVSLPRERAVTGPLYDGRTHEPQSLPFWDVGFGSAFACSRRLSATLQSYGSKG